MKAILSDVHGNLEALQAVLHDIEHHPVEAIYCLGDLVGYGPNPRECVDLAIHWKVTLLGNFDQAVLCDPPDLGPAAIIANNSLVWSRVELTAPVPDRLAAERRLEFLRGLPARQQEGEFLFVHGSPRNPLGDYVFPADINNTSKMQRIFALIERYGFNGHTHLPGIFTEDGRFLSPEEVSQRYQLDGQKTLVNVGSVGQPHDDDWRACYVLLLDGELLRFRRIEYDVEATIKKIRDNEYLDDFHGERLKDGR